jgi:hypothetical protein
MMLLADAWGQLLALMLAWPPVGATEVIVAKECVIIPVYRAVRTWFTRR